MFQNSREATSSSSISDLSESFWKEIQSAFGSSSTNGGGGSIPTSFVSVDLGGQITNLKSQNSDNRTRNDALSKVEELYELSN